MLCCYTCPSCNKAQQIIPEDKIYKLAKHKKIQLKNDKVIHLLHFNEPTSSSNGLIARPAFQATDNAENSVTKLILVNESVETQNETVSTEQPAKAIFTIGQELEENSTSKVAASNTRVVAPEISVHLKSFDSVLDAPSSLDSYESFNKFLASPKLSPRFRYGLDCYDGASNFGLSVYMRKKIKLGAGLLDYPSDPSIAFTSNSNKLPLLFYIHGVGGSSLIWKHQIEFFNERGFEIIAVDWIGHGMSSRPSDPTSYEFVEIAADLVHVFDMFADKSSRAGHIVIGHSYGCSFATYLAQVRKDLVTKLILISGGAPYPLEYNSPILKSPLCCIKIMKPCMNCRFYCSAFTSFCNLPEDADQAFQVPSDVLFYTMKGQTWHTGYDQYHRSAANNHCVLMIEGENDQFVPLDDSLEMIRLLPYSYLVVIKNGSHMALLEKPDLMNRLLYLFINDSFK